MKQVKEYRNEPVLREPSRLGRRLRVIGAFGLGAALGSIIALLFAPASGRVTRRRLILRVQALRRNAGRGLNRAQRVLAKKAEHVRDMATETFGHARDWVTTQMNNGTAHRRIARHRTLRHATAR